MASTPSRLITFACNMAEQPLCSIKLSLAMPLLAPQIFRGWFPSWCRKIPRRRHSYCCQGTLLAQPVRQLYLFRSRSDRCKYRAQKRGDAMNCVSPLLCSIPVRPHTMRLVRSLSNSSYLLVSLRVPPQAVHKLCTPYLVCPLQCIVETSIIAPRIRYGPGFRCQAPPW
jgi:hypothetical protein